MAPSDYFISLIRTWVPIAVGVVIAWLTAHGVSTDPTVSAGFVAGFTGLLSGAYYALVRLLEAKFPFLGVLLGVPKSASYPKASRDS
jgi:uncharacterized membrane protein